jgi:glutamate/aspartate transport system permease protein
MRLVVLPQAFRNMLPVLLDSDHHPVPGRLAGVRCSTSPISSGAAGKIAQRDGRVVEMYLFVAAWSTS